MEWKATVAGRSSVPCPSFRSTTSMRLLITTQTVNQDDPVLGFFHAWIEEFAKHYEQVTVICLYEGRHSLPANVRIYSLGKEKGASHPLRYALRFKLLAWKLRHDYDAVFVHMNQEYVLIAGALWKLLGKRVYFWRNHYAGSFLTDLAASFCTKIFCTSRHSYTARYKKTVLMPVGVEVPAAPPVITREAHSIIFLARIAPSKRLDMFLDALALLIEGGTSFIASVYGSPGTSDEAYYESQKSRLAALGLHDRVRFFPGITHEKTAAVFAAHEIFVNCSRSGMFDKTLFEAALAGALPLAVSDDWAQLTSSAFQFTDTASLAARLREVLELPESARAELQEIAHTAAKQNTLAMLMQALSQQIS